MDECSTLQGQSVLSRLQQLIETDFSLSFDSGLSPNPQHDSSVGISPINAAPTHTPKSQKSMRRVISSSQFEKQTYQRMVTFQRKKEERIKQVKEEKAREEMAEVKSRPEINKTSVAGAHIPIQDRVEDILKKKSDWLSQQTEAQRARLEAAEQPDLTFHPKIAQKPRNRRTVEEFEIYLESTKDKHDREIERLREAKEAKIKEELIFRPTISQKSQQLTRDKGSLMERMEDEAILSELRKKDIEAKYAPPFRPSLTPKSQQLASKRLSAQPVFTRLYTSPSLLIESLNAGSNSEDAAEVETTLAEKELENWRMNRPTGLDRFKPPEYPSTPSHDHMPQRYCDFLPSPKLYSPMERQYSSPISIRSGAAAVHTNCVTKLEYELKVRELEESHSREMDTMKAKLVDGLNQRMREFEDSCVEQYQAKVRSLESTHVSNADVIELQAKLEAFTLNEEILTRKFEGKLARADIALQEWKMRLAREQAKTADLTEELDRKSREGQELQERMRRLLADDGAKEAVEMERRSRERLASDYKRVAMELAEEKLRNKRDIEGDAKRHIKSLHEKNDQLMRDLQNAEKALHQAQSTIQSLQKSDSLERKPSDAIFEKQKPKQRSDSDHIEDLRLFYERKLMLVSEESLQWKNKSISLVTRFYPVLKQLKTEAKNLKEDVVRTKSRMQEELKTSVNSMKAKCKAQTEKPRRDTSRKRS